MHQRTPQNIALFHAPVRFRTRFSTAHQDESQYDLRTKQNSLIQSVRLSHLYSLIQMRKQSSPDIRPELTVCFRTFLTYSCRSS